MKIKVIKKGSLKPKSGAYCPMLVDGPPDAQ